MKVFRLWSGLEYKLNELHVCPCSTCPLQYLRMSLLRFCWSYSVEFNAWQSAQFSCWARSISTDSENPPVFLLLVFCWQCVRGVFYIFALYKCTFTYLLTNLLTYLLPYLRSCSRILVFFAQTLISIIVWNGLTKCLWICLLCLDTVCKITRVYELQKQFRFCFFVLKTL